MYIILLYAVHIVLCMDATTRDLVTPIKQFGEGCGYEGCPIPYEGALNVHIVPHTHGELGYYKTFDEYYTGYDFLFGKTNMNMKRILDFTISELWAKDTRTFTLSDYPYFFHWWANRDETVRRMVYQLIRQGRLQLVGAGWSMVDEASASYHALIDTFTYTLRKLNATFLSCGRPLVSWQADSYGHTREVASLLAQCGMDAHYINPMSLEDELRRMRDKELEMVWRGSDDLGAETDIYTHKLFDGYWSPPGFCFGGVCDDPLLVFTDSSKHVAEERADVFIESMKSRQSPHYTTNHVMVVLGMRLAYYDAHTWFTNIDKLIHEVNARSGGKIRLFYSSPTCYVREVHAANPELATKQDDFVPIAYNKNTYLSGHFTTRPSIKYMAREGHVYLQIAKQLQVLARLPPNSKLFEQFNWIMGVFQDHNVLSGAMRAHVAEYYTQKMYLAVQRSTILIKQAYNKLRKTYPDTIYYRCSLNISHCPLTSEKSYYIVIYNPLAWPVSQPVRLPLERGAQYMVVSPNLKIVKSAVMKLPDAVIKMPNRTIGVDHELIFIASNIPPLGFRSYHIDRIYPKTQKRSIILKLNKGKNKKYLIRQTNRKSGEQTLIDAGEELTYDDGDNDYMENVQEDSTSKIEFGNLTIITDNNNKIDIQTPKPKVDVITEIIDETTTSSPTTTTVSTTSSTTTAPTRTTTKTKATTTPIDMDEVKKLLQKVSVISKDKYISNKYINISLDESNQVASVTLSNKLKIDLKMGMFFYASDDPVRMGRVKERKPGAHVFRPMDSRPEIIKDKFEAIVLKTDILEELHITFAEYASFALKLYADQPTIEIDWVVGPIPADDEIGKEVFIRYETDLINDGIFYTDSNGRQTIKRIRFLRPDYEPLHPKAVAGNFYPVTSKIYIEDIDKNARFAVFTDRSQGGASLHEGQVDLMLSRRILTDDSGVLCVDYLNDTDCGQDVTVRGKHYLFISKASHKPHKIFEKKFAKEIELAPQILLAPETDKATRDFWPKCKNEYTALKKKLPIGMHILTIEEWNEGTLLLRLENYLEKADAVNDGTKLVFIENMFTNIEIKNVKETTLDGSKWLKEWTPLQWKKKYEFYDNFNDVYGLNASTIKRDDALKPVEEVNIKNGIKFTPQQIRTFVIWVEYVGLKEGESL